MNTPTSDTNQPSPKLAAPGAGLPAPELFIARLRFGWVRRTASRESLNEKFRAEQSRIVELAKSVSATDGARQVLIKRLRGMEDSSRNWSVFMTLEHLAIVNGSILHTVKSLSDGQTPDGKVSTADVKPSPNCDSAAIETFEQVSTTYIDSAEQIENLRTALSYQHPWFGPMDAFAWHALAAVHMGIHRVQIERIIGVL